LAVTPDGRGDQPIHHAARNGDTPIVRLLLEHGADAAARNPRGHTVLYCAGGHGHLETLNLLLTQRNDGGRLAEDVKALQDWLAQYPNDCRYTPIAEALQKHRAGA
jgi:ankyrin repeat protein